ncbi:MAG: thioredoxin domain-containing protein, partial [Ignavibacterium sp.]
SVFAQFLCGLHFLFGPATELIITAKEKKLSDEIIRKISQIYFPSKVIISINDSNREKLIEIVPHLKDYKIEESPLFYLCRNFVCEKPTGDVNEVMTGIKEL